MFYIFTSINNSFFLKCCEKGSLGKTQIPRKSVAKREQCCEKGDLRCMSSKLQKNFGTFATKKSYLDKEKCLLYARLQVQRLLLFQTSKPRYLRAP